MEEIISKLVHLKNEANLAAYSDSGAVWERETKRYEDALAEAVATLGLSKDELWQIMSSHDDAGWAGAKNSR
jgi:hypothetical protein